MSSDNSKIKQMVLVSLMTAIICMLAPISLTLPTSPIPISLGNMVICFTVTILGMKKGSLSVLIYLLLGLAGVPVFSNFTGGVGKLLGPTGGYLIGYLLLALTLGFFVDHYENHIVFHSLGAFLGMLLLYLFGTVWLALQLDLSFTAALWIGVIPYIPLDILKIIVALSIGMHLRKRLLHAGLL